jgi:alpha-tubulin suppressor-like RCC1 family protein
MWIQQCLFFILIIQYGQLGTGQVSYINAYVPTKMLNQLFEVSQFTAGIDFTLILSMEGFLYSCGSNSVSLNLLNLVWSIG